VCVCVCARARARTCVCVCLSGYTLPHFSTDLLQILRKPSTGHDTLRGLYIFVCVRLFLDGLYPNLLGTYYDSPEAAWATYFSCLHTARMRVRARVRARAWLSIRISLDGFSPNLEKTTCSPQCHHKLHSLHIGCTISYSPRPVFV
jgi:hypothetical protein